MSIGVEVPSKSPQDMNQPPKGIQDLVYSLEEGSARHLPRYFFVLLLSIFIGTVYHLTEFKNFGTAEAMDTAQLARNLAQGRGYTTRFIRPLSLHLLQQQKAAAKLDETQVLKQATHPDLANAPLYPLLLAGWMKVLPFNFKIPDARQESNFTRYQPDVLISYLNLALFLVAVGQVYFLGRKLFDPSVAAVAAAVVFGTELLWRFTYSGLSTNLLIVLLLGLAQVLVAIEQGVHRTENPAKFSRLLLFAIGAGIFTGLLCLTRYSVGILLLPVLGFLLLWGGPRRWILAPVTAMTFALIVMPWLARNHQLCGHWFGTAGYAMHQGTPWFSDTRLERSQNPDMTKVEIGDLRRKMTLNATQLVNEELPRLAGGYVTALFLVGLLIPFHSSALQRVRWLIVASIVVLLFAQALGRTHLTEDSQTVNSENLLVLVAPLVILFGVSLFFLLLDRVEFLVPQLRQITISGFILGVCLPLFFTLLPPRTHPLSWPPYHPLLIQQFSGWMAQEDLMMSDMPWAVAWYGQRECLWLTLRVKHDYVEDFYNVHDHLRPVRAIYLTPITADERWRPTFLNVDDPNTAWNRFYMDSLLRNNIPTGFPLRHALGGGYMSSGQFFLTDMPRWKDWTLRPLRR